MCTVCAALARRGAELHVSELTGSARVQRAAGGEWADLRKGMVVGTDDMVETSGRAQVVLSLADERRVTLGQETRALVTVAQPSDRDALPHAFSLNVMTGAALAQSAYQCTVRVYTPTAVVELTQGVAAVVVDGISSETGVTVLAGDRVSLAGVAQGGARIVPPGHASVAAPGSAPSLPAPITEDHVSILRYFLGDRRISELILHNSILPKPSGPGGVQALPGGSEVHLDAQSRRKAEIVKYPRLFRLNDIYGSILEDRRQHARSYRQVRQRGPLFDNHWVLRGGGGAGIVGGDPQVLFTLNGDFRWRFLDVGLRLRAGENHAGFTLPQFKDGLDGALDVIDHIDVRWEVDSLFASLGSVDDFTMGDGILVNRLSTSSPYSLYEPVGLRGRATIAELLVLEGYFADITDWSYGALRGMVHGHGYEAALGYYYDVNQYQEYQRGSGARYLQLPDTVADRRSEIHACEIHLGMDVVNDYRFQMRLSAELAYRFRTLVHSDGYVLRAPTLTADCKHMQFMLGYVGETGRLTSGMFGRTYAVDRSRPMTVGGTPELVSQSDLLSADRETRGFRLGFSISPLPGLAVETEYRQEFFARSVFADISAYASRENYDFSIRAMLNDTLVKYLKYAELEVSQVHGGLYPGTRSFADNFGFRALLRVLSVPLWQNVAAEGSFTYSVLDVDSPPDGSVSPDDRLLDFYLGLRWGSK